MQLISRRRAVADAASDTTISSSFSRTMEVNETRRRAATTRALCRSSLSIASVRFRFDMNTYYVNHIIRVNGWKNRRVVGGGDRTRTGE